MNVDTIPQFPKVIGFDVPRLAGAANVALREPMVALLDCVPSEGWRQAFIDEVGEADGALREAQLTLDGNEISFSTTPATARALSRAVKQFVEHVSIVRQQQRMTEQRNASRSI